MSVEIMAEDQNKINDEWARESRIDSSKPEGENQELLILTDKKSAPPNETVIALNATPKDVIAALKTPQINKETERTTRSTNPYPNPLLESRSEDEPTEVG